MKPKKLFLLLLGMVLALYIGIPVFADYAADPECRLAEDKVFVSGVPAATDRVIAVERSHRGRVAQIAAGQVSDIAFAFPRAVEGSSTVSVYFLTDAGIPTCAAQTIYPATPVTRIWMLERLLALLDVDTSLYSVETLTYSDCADLTDAEKRAVCAATDLGLALGYDNSHFAPYGQVARSQAATFLYRCAQGDLPTQNAHYSDVNSSAWYYNSIQYLWEQGVLEDTDTFSPNEIATQRDVMAWCDRMSPLIDAMREGYSVSNVRFVRETYPERNGAVKLAWDATARERVFYAVFGLTRNGWVNLYNTERTEVALSVPEGSYAAFRVIQMLRDASAVPLAQAHADLTLTVIDGGVDTDANVNAAHVYRGEYTSYQQTCKEYFRRVTGLSGYLAAYLRVDYDGPDGHETEDDFSYLRGDESFTYIWRDYSGHLPDSTYTVYGMSDYQLNAAGTAASYTSTLLCDHKPVTITDYILGNIRFERWAGLPVLAWDCSGYVGVQFEVYATFDGESTESRLFNVGGKSFVLPVNSRFGTCQGIRVRAMYNGQELASAENPDLKMVVSAAQSNPTDASPQISFTDRGGSYDVSLSGMYGFSGYSVRVSDGKRTMGQFDRLNDGAASFQFFNTDQFESEPTYQLWGAFDYQLADETLSYQMYSFENSGDCFP